MASPTLSESHNNNNNIQSNHTVDVSKATTSRLQQVSTFIPASPINVGGTVVCNLFLGKIASDTLINRCRINEITVIKLGVVISAIEGCALVKLVPNWGTDRILMVSLSFYAGVLYSNADLLRRLANDAITSINHLCQIWMGNGRLERQETPHHHVN